MKTLGPCNCKPGIERDNCPQCEGTGKRLDFASHRAEVKAAMEAKAALSEYDKQAERFLDGNGISFRATLSDSKAPTWGKDGKHGHHYRVTLCKRAAGERNRKTDTWNDKRITFDFWGSIADADKITKATANLERCKAYESGVTMRAESIAQYEREIKSLHPSAYDVLACLSSDANCPETFQDWCAEYGDSEDSLKALQTFKRCAAFGRRLRAFFTPSELEQLAEIQ